MKTKLVNVMVMVQLDVLVEGDILDNVKTALDNVNEVLLKNPDIHNAQLFSNNVENSDIIKHETEFEIGDLVEVPDPIESDIYNHSFVGTIVAFDDKMEYATVEDMEGDCFTIEIERLTYPD